MTENNATPPPPPEQPAAGQPTGGQPVGGQPVAAAPLADSEARTYVTLAHAGIAASAFIGVTMFAPLIIWLIGKDRSAFVDKNAKEALNFSILLTIAYVVGGILSVILIGLLFVAAAWICSIIFGIMGAIATNKGEEYRYPFNWRIIK